MIKKVNKNKFGVIEYLIEDMEDLKNLPKKDTDNATYAIMRKGNEKLIYLYSSSTKEWMLINEDLSSIKSSLDNMASDIEELKQGNIDVDLSSYAKKSDLEVKADKSYVDSAIESVDVSSQLTNYATKTELGNKVDKIDGKGLSTNDYTTAEKNKLSGLTNYTHPTSHSATMITEDSTHRFVTDSEKFSWNNKSNLALGTTTDTAFRGDYGNTAYTHSQTAHAPSNAQKNSDITKSEIETKLVGDVTSHTHSQYLTEHQDLSNYPKTSELTLGVHTDGLIYLFKGGQPLGSGVQAGSTGDIVGFIDENNNIILSGVVAENNYMIKYEMEDGTLMDIGELNLIPDPPSYTNLVPTSIDLDGNIFNGVGYKDGYRGNSSGNLSALSGCTVTGLIPFNPSTDTVRIKGVNRSSTIPAGDFGYVAIYDKSKTFLAFSNPSGNQNVNFTWKNNKYGYVDEDGSYVIYNPSLSNCYIETYGASLKSSTGYIRICGQGSGEDMIVTINERIE